MKTVFKLHLLFQLKDRQHSRPLRAQSALRALQEPPVSGANPTLSGGIRAPAPLKSRLSPLLGAPLSPIPRYATLVSNNSGVRIRKICSQTTGLSMKPR